MRGNAIKHDLGGSYNILSLSTPAVYRTVKFTCANDFMFLKLFVRFKT